MMLMNAQVDRHLREARLEHRSRYVPSRDEAGDDRIDIVEVEGGRAMSIWFSGKRFCAVRYHYDDDGGVAATEHCGWFDTLALAAVQVVAELRRVSR
jgi:hypothetical protein